MSQAPGPGILGEIRDSLARPFGQAVGARVPQVVDLLEQQLAVTDDRVKWKPLRGAIDLLRTLRPTLATRIAREVAARFDAKVEPGDSAFGKTARLSAWIRSRWWPRTRSRKRSRSAMRRGG